MKKFAHSRRSGEETKEEEDEEYREEVTPHVLEFKTVAYEDDSDDDLGEVTPFGLNDVAPTVLSETVAYEDDSDEDDEEDQEDQKKHFVKGEVAARISSLRRTPPQPATSATSKCMPRNSSKGWGLCCTAAVFPVQSATSRSRWAPSVRTNNVCIAQGTTTRCSAKSS
jgi:hypothetical protein